MKKISDSARARGTALRLCILGAAVLAALIGAVGRSGAASPVITHSQSAIPGTGASVAYSGAVPVVPPAPEQFSYVSYTVGFVRGDDSNKLTHARVSEPVSCGGTGTATSCADTGFVGATVVSVLGTLTVGSTTTTFCTAANAVARPATPAIGVGVTCPIGSLPPNSQISLNIVFQVPEKPAAPCSSSTFNNQAALLVDESTSDSQPGSSHQDTFATDVVTTNLVCDATNAVNTFVLPGTPATFQTDTTPGLVNVQSSKVSWGGGDLTLFKSGELRLLECGGPGISCASVGVDNPCPVACVTQTSSISVPGSDTFNLPYFLANPMTIALTFFPSDFPKGFNWRKLVIYHDTHQVRACPDRTSDPDCLVSLIQDKVTGNVVATINGPSNGGWGGI